MGTAPNRYSCNATHPVCADGSWEYAVWYTADDEIWVGKRALGSDDAFAGAQITGAARTELAAPVTHDDHHYGSIQVMGDGRIRLWANMRSTTMRCIETTNVADISAWSVPTDQDDFLYNTYPTPVRRPDGSVRFVGRADSETGSGAGRTNVHQWVAPAGTSAFGSPSLFLQGLSVPNAKGAGVAGDGAATDTIYNWTGYFAMPHVEDLGGGQWKEHWCWIWREFDGTGDPGDPLDRSNIKPSYAQYRSATNTWHAYDGTTVTPPFDPVNQTSVQIGTVAESEGYLNALGICLDGDGEPVIMLSYRPYYLIRRSGGAWVQTRLGHAVSGIYTQNGYDHVSTIRPVWFKDELWYLGIAWPLATGGNPVHPRMFRSDGTHSVAMGGKVNVSWSPYPLWHRQGGREMAMFIPSGDTPKLISVGQDWRAFAA